MRVLGLPLELPQTVVNRMLGDIAALALAARSAPDQLDRLLALGEEIVDVGRAVLEMGERIEQRIDSIMVLGERIDGRAEGIMSLGERLDSQAATIVSLGERIEKDAEQLLATGSRMHETGERIDARGEEIVDRATRVVETGNELIAVLPAFERALEMATPLEGAIDRFGRLVDRLPGGSVRRRVEEADPPAPSPAHEP
jgi:methyl-accepting chemotaxis protein